MARCCERERGGAGSCVHGDAGQRQLEEGAEEAARRVRRRAPSAAAGAARVDVPPASPPPAAAIAFASNDSSSSDALASMMPRACCGPEGMAVAAECERGTGRSGGGGAPPLARARANASRAPLRRGPTASPAWGRRPSRSAPRRGARRRASPRRRRARGAPRASRAAARAPPAARAARRSTGAPRRPAARPNRTPRGAERLEVLGEELQPPQVRALGDDQQEAVAPRRLRRASASSVRRRRAVMPRAAVCSASAAGWAMSGGTATTGVGLSGFLVVKRGAIATASRGCRSGRRKRCGDVRHWRAAIDDRRRRRWSGADACSRIVAAERP